jgi:FKBP-type peptidyl-prolyl cis-trans isomerase FklB
LRLILALVAVVVLNGCDSDSKSEAEREAFRQQLIDKALNDDTRKMGDKFLAQNANAEGVITRPSGLQYRVLKMGTGDKPQLHQFVVVNYEGRRVDGVVFDSTDPGRQATFPLKGLIKGWREGLTLMPIGSKWELFVPADLAYGATSPNELIPANSTLIFTVELVNILYEVE